MQNDNEGNHQLHIRWLMPHPPLERYNHVVIKLSGILFYLSPECPCTIVTRWAKTQYILIEKIGISMCNFAAVEGISCLVPELWSEMHRWCGTKIFEKT